MSNAAALLSVLSRHEFTELIRQKRPWFRRKAAAAYLDVSVSTMEVWAGLDKGPAFQKNKSTGMVRYHIDVLDAFLRKDGENTEQSN